MDYYYPPDAVRTFLPTPGPPPGKSRVGPASKCQARQGSKAGGSRVPHFPHDAPPRPALASPLSPRKDELLTGPGRERYVSGQWFR